MYRPLIPLLAVVIGLPAYAQTTERFTTLQDRGNTGPVTPSRLSEPASPLTLNRALGLATKANPALSGARHELQAIEATVLQAGTRPNPTVEVSVEDTRRATRETTVQLSQPLELGGKRARRVEAAERGRDISALELHATSAKVRSDVTNAFNDVVTAQERVKLAQESLAVAERVTTTVTKRVQAGKISPVEESRARVAQANVNLELLKARGELNVLRKVLAGFWGNQVPRFDTAIGDLTILPALPDWAELSAKLGAAPLLSRAKTEVERRKALVGIELSRRTPDVSLTVGMKRNEELGRNQAIFGVSLPLPLFDRNRGNVLESLRRQDKANDDLLAAETEAQVSLTQAYERLSTSRLEADSLAREILPAASSAYEAAAKGFDFGKFAYFDVLDAQRTLLQAKAQYISALSAAHRAAADIDAILGKGMPVNNE